MMMSLFWSVNHYANLLIQAFVLVSILVINSNAYAEQHDNYYDFDIPAQPADSALNQLAQQANIQLLFPYDLAKKYDTSSIQGEFTLETALKKLLDGTDLVAVFTERGDVTIQANQNVRGAETMKNKTGFIEKLSAFAISALAVIQPLQVSAQTQGARVLEEVVVTAQRREQSIQEVPVSLQTYSGEILNREGFRTVEDLVNFSPSVEIDARTRNQDITVRGMGTVGNNLGLEQAAPMFVDGVHFSRTSMIMGAFLDLERVELLRGPQPIAFGQNATVGAFSITTRKPSPEWEGNLTAEYGNWGRASVEGGVGGPITETLGIRVAGQYDRFTGYLKDVVSGDLFPNSDENAARITLQWNPTENLEATLKAAYIGRRRQGDGLAMCRTEGDVPLIQRAMAVPGYTSFADETVRVIRYPTDCENGFKRIGIREGRDMPFQPVQGIDEERGRGGILDMRSITETLMDRNDAHDNMDSYNYRLGISYRFDNGITIDSNTAYLDYQRSTVFDNSFSPVLGNPQHRGEIFDMVSQEIRVLSQRGGSIEWETGVYYQTEDLDLGNAGDPKYQTATIRANTDRPYRISTNWQDTEWMSVFGSLTFNFLDDKFSLDVGARYTDISKQSFASGLAATWVFDIDPDSADATPGDGIITGTRHTNGNQQIDVTDQIIDCATGNPLCGNYGAGFWTHEWRTRTVPDSWDTQAPVDISPILSGLRDDHNVLFRDYNDNSLDPQVTLRYRPTDNLSLYAKWVKAFKGGGADIATGSIPGTEEEFRIDAEHAENFELGAKGTLLDGAANYSVTLFQLTVDDMQVASNIPDQIGGGSFSGNAGKQRTRGVEFDGKWAVNSQLTVGVAGAIMDGKMLEFTGAGCNNFEFDNAETGPCLTAEESEELFDTDAFEGTIDRSGAKAPRTPDWKFVFDVDWWYPIGDRFKYMFSSKVTYVDSFINNFEEFDETVKYDTRVIANLNAGIGSIDDTWNLSFWVRNLFEEGLEYFPEFDVDPDGTADNALSPRNFTSYGIQYQYKFN